MPRLDAPVKAAVVGYGPFFNMGAHHAKQINSVKGMEVVAVCDLDKKRLAAAKKDLGDGIRTYTDVRELAKDDEVQLAAVVVPHNAHCPVALTLLKAGKHVVVEKPFAVTINECDRMIDAAKEAGVSLSVYHNRRGDGDFITLKQLIHEQGWIGDVFHLEACAGGYEKPAKWWRSDKEISGGAFYDWGAHFVDWVLNLMPGKMKTVSGQFQESPVWKHVTNEDHCEAFIKFDTGAVAHVQLSSIQAAPKPQWYVLGTQGAIVEAGGKFTIYTRVKGATARLDVGYLGGSCTYYEQLADHLLKDAPNPVTPESARRVIAVIELAEKSSRTGQEQKVPHE